MTTSSDDAVAERNRPVDLPERVRQFAQSQGDGAALVAGERRVSWRELDESVARVGRALRATGLHAGDRVALALPTGIEFVECYLGAWRAGLISVPVNPSYTEPELAYILGDSGASLLVSTSGGSAPTPVPTTTPEELQAHADRGRPGPGRSDEDIATLIYTSGTSGRPKGAMLSARALSANLRQIAGLGLVQQADVGLVPLPLFHVFGLNAALGPLLDAGATAVLVDRFDPAQSLALAIEEKVTVVAGAPQQFAAWIDQPHAADAFAGVRWAISGAAALPETLVRRYADLGVPLYQGYGLTETAPVLTSNVVSGKAGSIGRPLPGVDVRLCDPSGEEPEVEDPGELVVRGDNLFSGYWPDRRGGPDEDGWFRTGDIAVADEDGDLRIVGRTSDLIIVSAFNVYPAEVEAVLNALPGVADSAVTGEPDPVTGEAVVAYISPVPGAALDAEEIRTAAARSLARFKLPRRIEIVDALPHTVTGKVQKWRLLAETVDGPA